VQNKLLFFASVDHEQDLEIDKLWAKEAEERLAAYRLGEIRTLDLIQVLSKYQV
jgi:Putative addiction module component